MLYVWLDRTYRAKMDLAFVGDQENCSAMTDTNLSTCITMLDGQHALKENCILGNLRQQRWDNCRYILTGSYITQWKISGQYITKMKSQLCHTTRLSLDIPVDYNHIPCISIQFLCILSINYKSMYSYFHFETCFDRIIKSNLF